MEYSILKQYRDYEALFFTIKNEIDDRITYILRRCLSVFGHKLKYWYFLDASEGEVGTIQFDESEIYDYIIEPKVKMVILINGQQWNLNDRFPIRWLYDSDFENEIRIGKV